jgi:hypothetical protein
MLKLKILLEADEKPIAQPAVAPAAPAEKQPAQAPTEPAAQGASTEYSPAFDFNDFETKLAQATESAKNNFQEKLMSKVGGKQVLVRASKGQPGQPLKDYTIDVTSVSVDYYYDRYVVILKDEKEKEYFLNTMMKIKVLGPGETAGNKAPKAATAPAAPSAPAQPAPEQTPNTATQGI